MNRRLFLVLPLASALSGVTWAQPEPRVIAVHAKKFEFTPGEIQLKVGEPVVLEFTTEVVHRVRTKIEVWSSLGSAA